MKLLLLGLILLIDSFIHISNGQVFDYGYITFDDTLCFTVRQGIDQKYYLYLDPCNSNDKYQLFNISIGSTTLPTFKASFTNLCIHLAGNNNDVIPYDCTGNVNNRNRWSVKNTGYNEFYIISNHVKKCISKVRFQSTFVVSDCDGSFQQILKFVSLNNDANKVTYNVDSIQTVKGKFLDSQRVYAPFGSYQGLNYEIGGYKLRFIDCMLRVYNPSGELLWSSTGSKPSYCSPSATLKIQTDNNLCIYPHESNAIAGNNRVWCSHSADTGARYMVFIPPYSYGREFGIVLLNNQKQMVWAQFGKSVILDASYILIPGNFIDRLSLVTSKRKISPNQFITNGREYLRFGLNDDGRVRISKGFVTSVVLHWITKLPTIKGPYRYEFQSDSNFCIRNDITEVVVYCTMTNSTSSRYIIVPLLDPLDSSNWGWVIQDESNKLTFQAFN